MSATQQKSSMYILIERRTKKDCIFLNGNTAYKTINRAAKIELTGDVVSIALADKEGYKITIEKLKENL